MTNQLGIALVEGIEFGRLRQVKQQKPRLSTKFPIKCHFSGDVRQEELEQLLAPGERKEAKNYDGQVVEGPQ